ncbi:MAG: pilus assembly protein PilM, partial [Bdellovibrionales bacterium]|nr:pilus assembly protein PilM [Bdellovibrionales bacterium]
VLACTSPIERVRNILQVARDGGIEPSIISVEGLAFANLFEEWTEPPHEGPPLAMDEDSGDTTPPTPSSAKVILNIGHRSTLMIVWSQDRLLTARTLDWGGMDVAQALSGKYSLHIVEALKELRKKGFILTSNEGATRDQTIFSDTIKGVVDDFAHELHLAILEIESDHQIHIDKGFMSGGTCQIQNLGPYLTQKLEVPFNRLKQIPAHSALNFESGGGGEVSKAIAIALAIEGLKRPRNPAVNMLRGALAKQSQTLKRFVEKWGHSLAVAGAAFLVLMVWSIMRDSFSSDMASQAYEQMKIQAKNVTGGDLKGARANARNIRKFIREQEMDAKNRKLAEKVQTITSALDVFKGLTESTPSKKNLVLDVQKLIVDNDKVEVQGFIARAPDIDVLANAWKSLSTDGKVEKFRPGFAAKGGKTPFGLRLKVNRLKGK